LVLVWEVWGKIHFALRVRIHSNLVDVANRSLLKFKIVPAQVSHIPKLPVKSPHTYSINYVFAIVQ
jgi:hypothetical protein